MPRAIVSAVCSLAALLVSFGSAWACRGDKVLVEDRFTSETGFWGSASDEFRIADGRLVVAPASHREVLRWISAPLVGNDVDVCLIASLAETANAGSSNAGLVFWGRDDSSYYAISISGDGFFRIHRQAGARRVEIVPWKRSPALRPGQANHIRVTIEGRTASIGINDEAVHRFEGEPPAGTRLLGIHAASPEARRDVWHVTEFKVTNVPPPASTVATAPDAGSKLAGATSTKATPSGATVAPAPAPLKSPSPLSRQPVLIPPGGPVPDSSGDTMPNVDASVKIMAWRTLLLDESSDTDKALSVISEAIALEPTPRWRARSLYERGFFRKRLKRDIDGALADFNEAIRLDSNSDLSPMYLKDRAEILLLKGAYDEAIADLTTAIPIHLRTACARVFPEHQEQCRNRELKGRESSLLTMRGEALMYKADYPKALADLDRAIALQPNNVEAYINRARVHASRDDFSTALHDADRAIELDPKSFPAYFYRALVYKLTRQWDKAIADFEKVLEINPGNAGATEQLELTRTERARSVR